MSKLTELSLILLIVVVTFIQGLLGLICYPFILLSEWLS